MGENKVTQAPDESSIKQVLKQQYTPCVWRQVERPPASADPRVASQPKQVTKK